MLIASLSILVILCTILLINLLRERRKLLRMRQRLYRESRKLERSNHVIEAILKNTHLYIILINKDLKVLRTNYNQQARTQSELRKQKVGDLLKCCNASTLQDGCGSHNFCESCTVRNAIRDAFEHRTSFTELEISLMIRTSDNSMTQCDALISGIFFLLDGEENMVLTLYDITQQKQARKSLMQAKEKAEETDYSKSAFLSNIHKEIHAPLSRITDSAEVLAKVNCEEEKVKYKNIIDKNAVHLLQTINGFLTMSKIDAGTLDFTYSKTDVNQLLSNILQYFQIRTKNKGKQHVKIEITPSLPVCFIETDRNWVGQILAHFISNAIKFTKEGRIDIGYQIRETEIYFYVTDTGIGIPANNISGIFERYAKAQDTEQGHGLGLYLCKIIISKLGGKIGVESTEGEGSTFWFTIPFRLCGNPALVTTS